MTNYPASLMTTSLKRILEILKLEYPEQLINILPKKYLDYEQSEPSIENNNQKVVFYGSIASEVQVKFIKHNLKIMRFDVLTQGETVECTIFNQTYYRSNIILKREVIISGKYDYLLNKLRVDKIIFTKLDEYRHLIAYYNLPSNIPQAIYRRQLKKVIDYAIENNLIIELIPVKYRELYRLGTKVEAIEDAHIPIIDTDYKNGLRYLKYEEFLLYSISMRLRKLENDKAIGKNHIVNYDLINHFIQNLEFKITNDQKIAYLEILDDINSNKKMFRLLQGDVGSGKTIVAIIAILAIVSSKFQAVYMAPTDILARQVYQVIKSFLSSYNFNVGLLVSSLTKKSKDSVKEKILNGEVNIIVGTHAVIQPDIIYQNLGLAIIDEQHRFGVEQRSALINKGENVDTLIMSATPIPRTLAMALYGDMDISTLTEYPFGKREVTTKLKLESNIQTVDNLIAPHLKDNQQVFIICPLREDSLKLDLQNVQTVFQQLKELITDKNIALLHSKIAIEERDQIIDDFKNKKIDIIVSTIVIEVGIDIKNVNAMIIMDSERFGLAQLHQLRGRIGRGGATSYCYLLTNSRASEVENRLRFLTETSDGFEVSKFDLKLRGPGDFIGTKQSGADSFKVADILDDMKIFETASKDAFEILNERDNSDNQKIIEYVKEKILDL